MTTILNEGAPANSVEVRDHLIEALNLDLVGPWAGHALAEERLPSWVRPSNWYLVGFLIPSDTPVGQRDDDDGLWQGGIERRAQSRQERLLFVPLTSFAPVVRHVLRLSGYFYPRVHLC